MTRRGDIGSAEVEGLCCEATRLWGTRATGEWRVAVFDIVVVVVMVMVMMMEEDKGERGFRREVEDTQSQG